jgi:hypothetical protein
MDLYSVALEIHTMMIPPRRYAPAHVTLCDLSEFLDTMNACDITMANCSVRCKRFDGFWHNSQILEVIALGIRSGDIPVS